MTTSTAVPVKKICKALLCFARYFPVYPIWFCALTSKSKLRGANKAEAQVVVPVRRSVVVPVANRRVVGVVVPRTTPFDTVRTRRRAEPCRFCRKIPFFLETSRKSTKTSFSKYPDTVISPFFMLYFIYAEYQKTANWHSEF